MHPGWRRAALLTILAAIGCARSSAYPGGTDDQPYQAGEKSGSAAGVQANRSPPQPPSNSEAITLVEAAQAGDPDQVKAVLAQGASRQTLNEALFAAAGSEPLVEGPVNTQRDLDLTYAQTARLLLAKGANLEARNQDGDTPLMAAAGHGETEVVKLLLEKGAEIEARGSEGVTALIWAACNCPIIDMPDTYASMKLLMEHGANIEARDRRGSTPLMSAAGWGRANNAELLLDKGAKIEATDNHGNTALLIAASGSALPMADAVELLLKRGAKIEVRNNDGDTALILAASRGGFEDVKIVKLLLDHGADVRAKNNQGRTALDLAIQRDRTQIVALLKAAAAKPH